MTPKRMKIRTEQFVVTQTSSPHGIGRSGGWCSKIKEVTMKRVIVVLVAMLMIGGCAIPEQTGVASKPIEGGIPLIGDESSAGVGDVFFTFTRLMGFGKKGDIKYNLTVVELSEEKIGLQYTEYTYYSNPYTYSSGWLIKEGFNKRFDYAMENKVVRFKGFEFEIVGVKDGMITYKRTK